MKKRIFTALLCAILLVVCLPITTVAAQNTDDIVILYENDVHCEVDGYSKLAAMKHELQEQYAHVGVVCAGDFVQGGSLGAISKGEYIVRLMNLVGYDAVALGNHEFDYRLSRLEELAEILTCKVLSCNFRKIGEEDTYFDSYTMVTYGDVRVAYVGITTPTTIKTTSFPTEYKDEAGNFIYTFHPTDLYEVVQATVNEARENGADYVVALSHIGDREETYNIVNLIQSTKGIDVVLDAHSHSVIEGREVTNAAGEQVLLSSTGTKFEHIGKLTISKSGITTELIRTEEYDRRNADVDAYLAFIEAEYSQLGNRKIGYSEFDLVTHDADGNRLVRIEETNLGDFCADALKTVMGAQIGYMNGGAIRTDIPAGEVTFNDILNVHPFNNHIVVVEVSGQVVKDMLEMAMCHWPEENANFPHVSGMKFSVNTAIPSSVVLTEEGNFAGVSGPYRVYDILIYNEETGAYEPIDLTKNYRLAASNFILLELGDGMQMFEGAVVLQNTGILDVEVLEAYVVNHLNGHIGADYAQSKPNIRFTDGELPSVDDDATSSSSAVLWIVLPTAALLAVALGVAVGVTVIRKHRQTV